MPITSFVDRETLEIPVEKLASASRLELITAAKIWLAEYPPEDNISVSSHPEIIESYFRHLAFLYHLLDSPPSLKTYLSRRERTIVVMKSNYDSLRFHISVDKDGVCIWASDLKDTELPALLDPARVQTLLESDKTIWSVRGFIRTLAETPEARLFEQLYKGI